MRTIKYLYWRMKFKSIYKKHHRLRDCYDCGNTLAEELSPKLRKYRIKLDHARKKLRQYEIIGEI